MTTCPFRLCSAPREPLISRVKVVPDAAITTQLIRSHPLGGHEEFGLCPASLMYLPLTTYASSQLEAQAVTLERILAARQDAKAVASASDKAPEHSLTPHPVAGGLFSTGSAHYERRGTDMATVAEVRRQLGITQQTLANARLSATNAGNLLVEALSDINRIRQTSVDPIGAPQIGHAIDLVGDLKAAITAAIEAAETYKGSL